MLNHLKQDPSTRHIPVQLLTLDEDWHHGLSHGAFAFVIKPTTTEGLQTAIARIREYSTPRRKRLLVVEDDATQRLSIEALLGHSDIEVSLVSTAAEALSAVQNGIFDCVVLDLRLHHSDEALIGRKVLVVDDDVRNIFALSGVLERRGMEVLTAGTGREAIDMIEKTPELAIVLMDIMMPKMDGYETMQVIRQNALFRRLPIIALSANAMRGDHLHLRRPSLGPRPHQGLSERRGGLYLRAGRTGAAACEGQCLRQAASQDAAAGAVEQGLRSTRAGAHRGDQLAQQSA